MHSFLRVFSCGMLLAVSLPCQAADRLPQEIVEEGLQHSQVMAFQDRLCQDFGSRLTGSLAFDRAADWAVAEFQRMGLTARLEPWGEWQVGWDREQWMGRMLSPVPLELQVATPAWTAATKGEVTGMLVAMPASVDAAHSLQVRIDAGEALYLFGPLPKDGDALALVRPWLDQGKVRGRVQSAESTGWTDKNFPNQIRVFGDRQQPMRPFAERPVTPWIVVRDDQAAVLQQQLAGDAPVVVQFELRNRWRQGPVALNNVVADLVGSEHPEELVLVCAHLDSWHQATGATDNGTGTCSTLEAARILTAVGLRPKRTIRFLLWGGEEQGLLGSHQYVVRHRREMHAVSALFNHDGGTNWVQSLTVPQSQFADFQAITAPLLTLLQPPQPGFDKPVFELRAVPVMQPAGGGSDHASFGAVGVPAFAWGQTGEVPYGRGWHSQWDTYSIVVPQYQRHTATVIAAIAAGVADLDHLLSREGVERRVPDGPVNAGLVAETWLGVELDGMTVKSVHDGSPAQRGGVVQGDVIAQVGDTAVADAAALVAALRSGWEKGAEVAVQVQRGGKGVTLTLHKQ